MNLNKYYDGLLMGQFHLIKEISQYNHNYYVGLDNDLLFARSDDDHTTDWWLIFGENSYYLGQSYSYGDGERERLHRFDSVPT